MTSKTRPLKVHNAAFLLERLAADCAPMQEYRELTQNAIEAIVARPEGHGDVVWDVDWRLVEARGVYKLCIVDTGVGMSPDQMQAYINDLSHSGREQGLDKNFGVGAKITAGVRNPSGIAYFSWRHGQGASIHFWRDPDTGVYGLRQFEMPDETFAHWRPVPDHAKPELITESGTLAVLLGSSDTENTALCREGTAYPSHWLARYLNTRYFQFPTGIRVRVREFARRDPAEWPRSPTDAMANGSQLREVVGQRPLLDRWAQHRGQLSLPDVTLHWWLMRDEQRLNDHRHFWQTSGHVASLYQDELYEMRAGAPGQRLLQQFGILFGTNRVVIYAEPCPKASNVSANTARSQLLVKGQRLPWDRWAEQFRRQMPPEIQQMMNEIVAGADSRNHKDAIKQRLATIRDLFEIERYRRVPGGPSVTDGNAGGSPSSEEKVASENAPPGQRGGKRGDLYGDVIKLHGDPAKPIRPSLVEPDTSWVQVSDGTRTAGDLEDRAARYLPAQHALLINGDFRVFDNMVRRWTEKYQSIPGAPGVIRDVVREWFEQQLVETVMGIRALRGSPEWSADDIATALSEEALSAAVMPRWQVNQQIGRVLARRLGGSGAVQNAA